MTTLEAVKRILEYIGEPTTGIALDTGGTSDISEAETYLDRANRTIQTEGWAQNTYENYQITLADITIAASGGSGTFTFGETVTGGTSGATGTFYYETGGSVALKSVVGTFQDAETITGTDSSATRTTSADPVTVTSGRLVWEPTWIRATPYNEAIQFSKQGDYLYDRGNLTLTFNDSVYAEIVYLADFNDLSEDLAEYIVAYAAMKFQRYKKRGNYDEQVMGIELREARVRAKQEDTDLRGDDLTSTDDASRVKGNRINRTRMF